MSVTLYLVNFYIKHSLVYLVHIALPFDVQPMTFWHKLRHWPIVTRIYIEMFDSVTATGQINFPDVHTMTFGQKLRHWPTVKLNYIEKFDSVTATGQINLPVGCQPYLYFLSFSTLTTSSGQLNN